MASEHPIVVEVVYALNDEQHVVTVNLACGATVSEAIEVSRLCERYPQIGASDAPVGIYGRIVSRDTVLHQGDRVEIYRPLVADPKQARRRRALRGG